MPATPPDPANDVAIFTAAIDPTQQLRERWATQFGTPEGVHDYRSLLTAIEKHNVIAARKALGKILPSLDLLVGELDALDDRR